MSLFHQWKASTLQFWEKYQTTPTNKDLWYIFTEKWNRSILPPTTPPPPTTTTTTTTSTSSWWEALSTKIQVVALKLLDRTWDYSYDNPDVVLFIFTFLYVRWDLKPYLHHHDDDDFSYDQKSSSGRPSGSSKRTRDGIAALTLNDDDHYIEDGIVKVKRKVYKDKGLYNFIAQCEDMKNKLRRVEPIDSKKKMNTIKNKVDQKSSFLNLSPERLRNLRGNLKSTPGQQLV